MFTYLHYLREKAGQWASTTRASEDDGREADVRWWWCDGVVVGWS